MRPVRAPEYAATTMRCFVLDQDGYNIEAMINKPATLSKGSPYLSSVRHILIVENGISAFRKASLNASLKKAAIEGRASRPAGLNDAGSRETTLGRKSGTSMISTSSRQRLLFC